MDKIKNLIFDMTGVLAEDTTRKTLTSRGFTKDEINNFEINLWSYYGRKKRKRWEEGYLNSSGDKWTDHCAKCCVSHKSQMLSFPPYIFTLIESLHCLGYGIYVLGDVGHDLAFELESRDFSFYPREYTDGEVWSSFEHRRKPSSAIYNILFERYHLNPKECLYLDDDIENINAGKTIGMYCVLVKSPDDTVSFLKDAAEGKGIDLSGPRIIRPYEKHWTEREELMQPAMKAAENGVHMFVTKLFTEGDIIYPSEISGRFSLPMRDTYRILEGLSDEWLLTSLVQPFCPSCHRPCGKAVLSVFDLPEPAVCDICGRVDIDAWRNAIVVYRKIR